ncbi:sugar ABC transporter ATP-binding protein [uncultured Brachyspira sp.]|uniref:sugar ABC transporter ATP-binding protein n=1 Tax=uncultured Brachyspira sp. TaxID=221953 RepID=UPI00262EB3F1|nr:sugar ABC transporter ATP-binding protein [uncultured Brachyspira sp.]
MSDIVFSAKNISKGFFGVPVLKDVNLDMMKGEVHAILGENGAGKSTLMKIIAGVYTYDSGELFLEGKQVHFDKPADAINSGIITIHQELNMCTHLTVMENLFLAREYKKNYIFLDKKRMRNQAIEWLSRFGMQDEVDTAVKRLPISKQQIVEIARAVSLSSKVLIMDEPTSSLSNRETEQLFNIIHNLKNEGISIIYISHRLEELEYIADRITVLRDGNFIMSKPYKDTNIDEIISAMADRTITDKYPRIDVPVGETILDVKNIACEPFFRDVSFEVKKGEILGFAGLVGAGRTKIAKSLFGVFKIQKGDVILNGKKIEIRNIKDAIKNGVVYVPEDRKHEGLALKMSIWQNSIMPNMQSFSNPFFINIKSLFKSLVGLKDNLKIKMREPEDKVQFLSGGNQQKVMIGKWILNNPFLFIFDEPTRGVDVNSKINIYNIINDLKKSGHGIMVISSELPELLGICDRIIVVSNGRITGEVDPKNTTQEEILRYATINY